MSYFNKYLELKEMSHMAAYFIKNGKAVKYRKNEYFMRQDEKTKFIGYVKKGGFRYLKNTESGEHIVGYSFENDYVADYPSLQMMQPAVIDAQAIKSTTVYILNKDELNHFFRTCGIEDFRCKIVEVFLGDIYDRLLSMYCDTPEKRYQNLLEHYPDILRQVSLKEIASLINVVPETLSRIRKKISYSSNP